MSVVIADNLAINTADGIPPFPLSHARIGYLTICSAASVFADSETPGFPAVAAVNPLTAEQWRPVSLPATWTCLQQSDDADYIGIAEHNLSGAVVSVEFTTNGTTWTQMQELSPGDNSPIMILFTPRTALGWRFVISSAPKLPQIGAIYIGKSLAMQRRIYGGHTPVTLGRVTELMPVRSEGGQFLGRQAIRKGVGTTYSWDNLEALWYRQQFDPFVKAAIEVPFFISWYPEKYPAEVGFVWTTGDITPQNSGTRDLMSVSMTVVGNGGE